MVSWECNCGWVNSASTPVCPNCSAPRQRGKPIEPPAAPNPEPARKPSHALPDPSPIVLILAALTGLFVVLGIAAMLVAAARHAAGH